MKTPSFRFLLNMLLFFIAVHCTGCVTFYYKTSDIRNNMNDASRKLDETIASVTQFHNEQLTACIYLSHQQADTLRAPYPEIFSLLKNIHAVADKLQTYKPQLVSIKEESEKIFGDKKKIESNKPEWDHYKPIRSKYSDLLDEMNDCIKEGNSITKDISKLEKKYGIGKMNIGELRGQIQNLLNDIEKNKTLLQSKTKQEETAFIDEKTAAIKKLLEEINTEAGEKTEVWIADDSMIKIRFDEIKNIGEVLNAEFKKIQKRK